MPILDNVAPIDDPAEYQGLLQDLQANILSAHGKPCAEYFFVQFGDAVPRARLLLALLACDPSERARAVRDKPALSDGFAALFEGGALANVHATSEWQVSEGGRRERRERASAVDLPLLAMLAASGYEKLGTKAPEEPAFLTGMVKRGERLNDRPKAEWGKGYADTEFDALVVLAFDPELAGSEAKVAALAALLGTLVVHRERGFTLRNPSNDPVEPFGFRDNLSQPIFYASDLERVRPFQGKAAEPLGGRWRSFAPLNTVLVPDPAGTSAHPCGTFVVFRKLRQNVEEFNRQVGALATKLDRSPGDVAADLFGRTREGWPLAGTEDRDNMNDFNFTADSRCPLHAHIRKANPRNDSYSRQRRIVRRGLAYRSEAGEVGLLFLCAQSNIEKQFEAIQQWMNTTIKEGADPIAGQPLGPNRISLRDRNGNTAGRIHTFESPVSLQGGEYFFMPSLSALKALQ